MENEIKYYEDKILKLESEKQELKIKFNWSKKLDFYKIDSEIRCLKFKIFILKKDAENDKKI